MKNDNGAGLAVWPQHLPGDHGDDLQARFSFEDFGRESACSSPYVSSTPSSPSRPGSFIGNAGSLFYSCPPSPMHFLLSHSSISTPSRVAFETEDGNDFEFPSGVFLPVGATVKSTMSSADELFLNGKIRPLKIPTPSETSQEMEPLESPRGAIKPTRDKKGKGKWRDGREESKLRSRRSRSMSPLRSVPLGFLDDVVKVEDPKIDRCGATSPEVKPSATKDNHGNDIEAGEDATSRSSSAGRNSKRWEFLKELLYRSKSEGRSNKLFWTPISFSPGREKKAVISSEPIDKDKNNKLDGASGINKGHGGGKKLHSSGVTGKTKGSVHEQHYKASRAQAEEMRKKTFLPYRQGLLGCLGFNSKGYSAFNGLARALNTVSSR